MVHLHKKIRSEEEHINLPPLPDQRRIVAYLDSLQIKVDELRRLQAESSTELDAMMPAVLEKALKANYKERR